MCIDKEYKTTKDDQSPKKYSRNTNYDIDSTLDKFNDTIDRHTSWWEVVDILFNNGYIGLSEKAQTLAVPILADIIAEMYSEDVKEMYTLTTSSGEDIIKFTARKLSEASGGYPILTSQSAISSQSRVSYTNLNNVCAFQ